MQNDSGTKPTIAVSGAIRSYYGGLGEREWARLTTPLGAIEFAVNTQALGTHLPPCAKVLDIGGGPARYALWLAQQGHRVTLADLSPELLAFARRQVAQCPHGDHVEAIVEVDARDLSQWADESFDAALSLGPFYHLPDSDDRDRAAAELARVLRPGGLAFVAFMTRYSLLRRTAAIPDERHHLTQPAFVARLLEDGVFINDVPARFTHGYGAHPSEIIPFFQGHGLEAIELLASEGIGWGIQDALAEMAAEDPAAHQTVLDIVIRTASDPAILGASDHLLYVGEKAA
jgi:SAM-dependent methyltransferase